MKSSFYTKALRLWAAGLVLGVLRWLELRGGFDPATGLSRPNLPGTLLPAAIALLAAVEIFLCLKVPRGKYLYGNTFAPMEGKHLPFLAGGCLLFLAGGVLLPGWDTLKLLTAAAGIAAAAGLVLFARLVRGGGEAKSAYLLPAMLFTTLFVLTVYLPQDSSPVFARYYLDVLTASLTACAVYWLAGFPCREASLRWFLLFANLAVPLNIASAAGAGSYGHLLIFAGCAAVLTVFLALRRDGAQPEPEEPKSQPEPSKDSPQI